MLNSATDFLRTCSVAMFWLPFSAVQAEETPPIASQRPSAKPNEYRHGSPEEPFLKHLSLVKAAESLDRTALSWIKEQKCGACHTTYPYLMARASLGQSPSPALNEVRSFFEGIIAQADDDPKPVHHGVREIVANAAALAMLDAQTTGRLHRLTRAELDRMWKFQRKDGAWGWTKCGWAPFELDDYYGAVMAAIALGYAPENYAASEVAKPGVEKLRTYFAKTAPPSLHHQIWLLWASVRLSGLMTDEQRKATITDVLGLQRSDGGWSMESLGTDWVGHEGEKANPNAPSDGYGTGLAIFVLRQVGVPASHDALRRGVQWLAANQRISGRWFTRSMNGVDRHFMSDTATAFAVLALKSCESDALK